MDGLLGGWLGGLRSISRDDVHFEPFEAVIPPIIPTFEFTLPSRLIGHPIISEPSFTDNFGGRSSVIPQGENVKTVMSLAKASSFKMRRETQQASTIVRLSLKYA